jgi:hypothetical protein
MSEPITLHGFADIEICTNQYGDIVLRQNHGDSYCDDPHYIHFPPAYLAALIKAMRAVK